MANIRENMVDLAKQAVDLRDKQELAWHDVAGRMDVSVGRAMLAYNFGKVKPSERVKADSDEALARAIVKLRDNEELSWGIISARTGEGEMRCRALYESVKGPGSTKGNRIGKGGRYPGGGGGKKPIKKATAKKAPAKKTTAVKKSTGAAKRPTKKAAGARKAPARKAAKAGSSGGSAPGTHPLSGLGLTELKSRLEGKPITILKGSGKDENLKIRTVKDLDAADTLTVITENGNQRNFVVTAVRRVGK